MKVTLSGNVTNSWYDVIKFDKTVEPEFNHEQAGQASERIAKILEQEAFNSHEGDFLKVWIGGSKQGGFLAYNVCFTMKEEIGGIVGISCSLEPLTEIEYPLKSKK